MRWWGVCRPARSLRRPQGRQTRGRGTHRSGKSHSHTKVLMVSPSFTNVRKVDLGRLSSWCSRWCCWQWSWCSGSPSRWWCSRGEHKGRHASAGIRTDQTFGRYISQPGEDHNIIGPSICWVELLLLWLGCRQSHCSPWERLCLEDRLAHWSAPPSVSERPCANVKCIFLLHL